MSLRKTPIDSAITSEKDTEAGSPFVQVKDDAPLYPTPVLEPPRTAWQMRDHGTKLVQLEEAATALGGRLVVSFEAA